MFIAQGNRLLNYYLFSGGENYRFDTPLNDGNDRIAFTGQKHGFAAPINHNLERTTTFDMNKNVTNTILANSESIATMFEEYDNLVFSFIPDYYMTEYFYPNSQLEKNMIDAIKSVRDDGMWSVLARSLLLLNYSFTALDIQNNSIKDSIDKDVTLVLTSTLYMSKQIQENVVAFLQVGGNMFLYGKLPIYDMEGNPVTILADYLEVSNIESGSNKKEHYYTSVYPCGIGEGYEELTVNNDIQTVDCINSVPFLKVYGSDKICGFIKNKGESKVVAMLTTYHCQLPFMKKLFEQCGMYAKLSHDYYWHGIFLTSTINEINERFIHIINVDMSEKECHIFENNTKLFEHKLYLKPNECLMLPMNLQVLKSVYIKKSTAEIYKKTSDSITFRVTQDTEHIYFNTKRDILESEDYSVVSTGEDKSVIINSKRKNDEYITLKFI
jgi:beta-galactosidase